MSRRLRVNAPPHGSTEFIAWAQQVTDGLNTLPAFSISSTTNGPNSQVTADSGTFLFDHGSSNTTLWFKASGSTTTGWQTPLMSPIAYVDLPTGSGTWETGSGTTVTIGRDLQVTSKLSLGSLTGPLRADAGVVSVAVTSQYTVTNVTTDRAYDANATSVDELADVLGTLIADLRSKGYVI